MLKNTLKSLAALLFASGSTLAVDVSGVYTTQSNGQQIAIELAGEGQQVRGVVQVNGSRLPLAAEEANGQLRGVFQTANGQQMPFVGAKTASGLLIRTADGKEFTFASAAPAHPAAAANNAGFGRQPAAAPVAPAAAFGAVQVQQGQVYALPLPQGWRSSETGNEVFAFAPDMTMSYGFVGLERIQARSAQNYLAFIFGIYGNKDVRFISAQRIQYQGATEAIEALVIVTTAEGREVRGWARVVTMVSGGQMNGYVLMVLATPDRFEQAAPQLQALAEKIQITNGMGAFDRAGALRNIQMVQNRPMDHSFASGYWKNQQTQSNVYARGSDVRRGQYGASDPATGQRYTFGVNGYDPARGGYVNPTDPSKLLVPDPHWQGR
jgi:hypothetical protein